MAERANDPTIVGNVFDKYTTRNPIARHLMAGFLRAVDELWERAAPREVLEVGCGEGRLAQHLLRHHARPQRFEICDLSLDHLDPGLDRFLSARAASIYALPFAARSFDLVVCCEVLEHLEDPRAGLREAARVSRQHLLISTPREPIWRAMNMARGKYLHDLGNTPGHLQHFSRRALLSRVEAVADILEVRCPLPWTVVLARVR